MKIAISGKGGVGKTTLASLLAFAFAKSGKKVILIDADPDSNLASTLGLPENLKSKIKPLSQMFDLIEERTGARPGSSYGALFSLNPKVDDLVDRYGLKVNSNITLLVLGTIQSPNSGCFCPENVLLKRLLEHLILERNEVVLLDMEAGIEHLGRGSTAGVDWLLIVVEPNICSIETAARIKNLALELGVKKIGFIVNKLQSNFELISRQLAKLKLPILGALEFDCEINKSELCDGPLKYSFRTTKVIEEIIAKLK